MTHRRTSRLIGATQERCPYCTGSHIIKKGRRTKQHETVQLWYCHDCARVFTPQRTKGTSYPIRVIIAALTHYHRGHTAEATRKHIKERYGMALPIRTL